MWNLLRFILVVAVLLDPRKDEPITYVVMLFVIITVFNQLFPDRTTESK